MQDDDEIPPKKDYPLSPAKMSKTPSWIMLGFVLGALSVFALRPREKPALPAAPPTIAAELVPSRHEPRDPGPLSYIETIFESEGRDAVWSGDTTEVALWDPKTERFADYYEIRRLDDKLYFRTIPTLTRRIINRGKPNPNALLQFTETEEQYQEWLEYGRRERPMQRMWERPQPATPALPAPQIHAPSTSIPVAPPSVNAPAAGTGEGK